ncbi:hypothetical protein HNQ63_002056, partial [Wenzhouxiangella marina]|nr:hypothetical protein [Wenzhouxiangella marina]
TKPSRPIANGNGWPPYPPRCLGHPSVGLSVMSGTLRRRVDGDFGCMDRRARGPDLRFADIVPGAPPLPINGTPDHRMPRARPTSTLQIDTRRRSGPRPRRSISQASPPTRRRDPPTATKNPTHTSRRRQPGPNEAIATDRQRNGWPPHPPRCLGHPSVGLSVMSGTLRRRVDGDFGCMDRRARGPDLRFPGVVPRSAPLP